MRRRKTQQWIIWLLPVKVFLLCTLVGWYGVTWVNWLLEDIPTVEASNELVVVQRANQPTWNDRISPIFMPSVQAWGDKIVAWAEPLALDPNLVATVMQIESCGAPHVVSKSGAQGLFQVMPFHFEAKEQMQDPDTNAKRGLAYLALGLARSSGDEGLALAGYNGGHSQIGKGYQQWPTQTQRYWYWGTGIYAEASSGATESARLQEWLKAGGQSLCNTAEAQLQLP